MFKSMMKYDFWKFLTGFPCPAFFFLVPLNHFFHELFHWWQILYYRINEFGWYLCPVVVVVLRMTRWGKTSVTTRCSSSPREITSTWGVETTPTSGKRWPRRTMSWLKLWRSFRYLQVVPSFVSVETSILV